MSSLLNSDKTANKKIGGTDTRLGAPPLWLNNRIPHPPLTIISEVTPFKILLYDGRIDCAQKGPANNYTIPYVWGPALFTAPPSAEGSANALSTPAIKNTSL